MLFSRLSPPHAASDTVRAAGPHPGMRRRGRAWSCVIGVLRSRRLGVDERTGQAQRARPASAGRGRGSSRVDAASQRALDHQRERGDQHGPGDDLRGVVRVEARGDDPAEAAAGRPARRWWRWRRAGRRRAQPGHDQRRARAAVRPAGSSWRPGHAHAAGGLHDRRGRPRASRRRRWSAAAARRTAPARRWWAARRALPSGESMNSTSTAKTGTARPTLEMLTASAPPLPRWPSDRATGRAIAQAMREATRGDETCSPSRCQTPSAPDQLAPVVSQSQASPSTPMPASHRLVSESPRTGPAPASRPGPRA